MASREAAAARRSRAANISAGERWASLVVGGALVVVGLRRASLPGVLVSLAGGGLVYRGLRGYSRVYESVGIAVSGGRRLALVPRSTAVTVERTVSIEKPAEELYRFWRRLDNVPAFMRHVESVRPIGERRSHWVVRGPRGRRIEWDAEIVEEREFELISWSTLPGGDLEHSGTVRFGPGSRGRGTEVRVSVQYQAPGGMLGAALARLFGEEPAQQVDEALRRFKQLVEAGEIPTTAGQPSGREQEGR